MLPFVRLCLEKHPKSRATADELLTLLRDGHLPTSTQLRDGHPATSRPATSRPAAEGPKTGPAPLRSTAPPPGDTTPEPARPGGSRRRRYLLAAAAVTAVTAVLAATTVVLGIALSRDSEPGPPAAVTRSDLPEGWKPWATAAKAPKGGERLLSGADSSLAGCAAVDTSLVCAGAHLMATRFALADGRSTWSRPVDPTADGSSSNGALIGAADHHVYAYEAEEGETAAGPWFKYTVYALAADTGEELWRTGTGTGQTSSVPDSTQGAATAVPEGVVTFYGSQGDQYALLDAETGEVRWTRPKPSAPSGCLLRSAPAAPTSSVRSGCRDEEPDAPPSPKSTRPPERPGGPSRPRAPWRSSASTTDAWYSRTPSPRTAA